MSDRMTVAEARELLDGNTRWIDMDDVLNRALNSVVAQAAQIERLQAALRDAEIQRRGAWVEYGVDIDPHGHVNWEIQYADLLPGDMEEK